MDTLRLIRNGKEIQAIRIGRAPMGQRFAGAGGHMEDVAYFGFADYLPEAFEPPATDKDRLALEIVNEAKDGAIVREELQEDLLRAIWKDFAPLRTPTPH